MSYLNDIVVGIVYDATNTVLRVIIPAPGDPPISPSHQRPGEFMLIRRLPAGMDLSDFCRKLGLARP